ncbi:YbaB/EbfC family nucleoid-associated protein [Streptomyces sp. MBT65]|uniref:YbaB/EbfC family nucleoid-associated protein n=1 Tax=Streptomyces sp. MBT65 TaxID=1488395 RepID=UPI00190912A2|nr:YbaB/EbfC family nucleoid-associated protein [Streptomyces sp. MBT65]MBK3579752.1 YbaB/EbfC family nucleoid-associated protein [Streptomyces sp. MBT65]
MTQEPESGPDGYAEQLERRLAQARAELAATEREVARAEAEMGDLSSPTVSKDGSVEVTVGPRGELSDLRFLGGKFREMSSAELGAAIIEAVEAGRAQARREAAHRFRPLDAPGPQVPELAALDIDWARFVGPSAPARSNSSRSAARTRLHDEIADDEEDGGTR